MFSQRLQTIALTWVALLCLIGSSACNRWLYADDSITVNSGEEDTSTQIQSLDAKIQNSLNSERLLQNELLDKRRAATEGERKWQSLLGELEQNSLQKRDLDQSLKKSQKLRDDATESHKQALASVEAAKKELEAAQKRLKDAEANAQKAAADVEAAQKPVSELEGKLRLLADQVEPLNLAATKAEADAAPAIREVAAMQGRIAEMKVQRSGYEEQIETLLKSQGQWISFTDQIAPIFQQKCVACHNPRTMQGGYNLSSFSALQSDGDSGQVIVPGHSSDSYFVKLIEDGSMPSDSDPLTNDQIALIRRWIDLGARLESHVDADSRLVRLIPRVAQPTAPEHYAAAIPVTALAVAPSGQLLVSSGYHELLVWSLPEASLVRRIPGVAERVYGMTFHADGRRVAVASGTPGQLGEVKIFDIETGVCLNDLLISEDGMFDIAFSPDGNRLAACGADGSISIFNVADTTQAPIFIEDHSDWVNSIRWSPDGRLLLSSSRDKTVKVFDSATGTLKITMTGHSQNITTAIFSDDGERVISGGDDRRLRVWKATEAEEVKSFSVSSSDLTDLQRLSDGRVLVAGSEKYLRLYEFADGKEIWKLELPSCWVVSIAVSQDERTAYCGTQDGQIHRIGLNDKPAVERSWLVKP